MKPRTILVRTPGVIAASRPGQALLRAQIKGEEVRAWHQALSWFVAVFVLGFLHLACRKPTEETQKAVVQITRPQVEHSAKGADIKLAPSGQLAGSSVQTQSPVSAELNARKNAGQSPKDKVAENDKAGSEPLISGVKGAAASPLSQPTGAAKDSKTLRPIAEHPANRAALAQGASSVKDRGAPVSTWGKEAKALTPTAKATQAANGSEALHTRAEHPVNQAALAQVALRDADWTVRKAAVEGLTNQGVLAQVAVSDEDLEIRKLAVSRLTVQAALAKVATSDKDWSVRRTATAMLTEQGVLASIALVDTDSDIRKLAVSLLTDQAALARVARSDKDWSVRKSAVNKLTSRSSLAQVATSDKDPDIRKLAVSRLIDQTTTREADLDN